MTLTLKAAIEADRLEDFAEQAEAEGIGPINSEEFENRLGRFIAPQPEDQTSR